MRVQIVIVLLGLLALSACVSNKQPALEPVLTAPVDQRNTSYLQMGPFPDQVAAEQLLQRASDIGISAYIIQQAGSYQVKSGPYVDADQALRHKLDIDRMLNIEARVVFE